MTILTRHDNVGSEPFDSIEWAFDEHLNEPDDKRFNYAVLYGNEDAPDLIEFYSAEPTVGTEPDRIWHSEEI